MSFSHRLPNVSRRCADLNLVVFWLDGETTLPEGIVVTTTWFHVSLQMINIRCSIVALIPFVMHLSISNACTQNVARQCALAFWVQVWQSGAAGREGAAPWEPVLLCLLRTIPPFGVQSSPEMQVFGSCTNIARVRNCPDIANLVSHGNWEGVDQRASHICIVMRSVTELIFSIQSCHEVSKITQLS